MGCYKIKKNEKKIINFMVSLISKNGQPYLGMVKQQTSPTNPWEQQTRDALPSVKIVKEIREALVERVIA
jgi:hypothetical protein